MTLSYFLASPAIWLVALAEYLLFNRGYSRRTIVRTAAVYAAASIFAMLPMALAGHAPAARPLAFAIATSFLYQLSYPLLHRISPVRTSTEEQYPADAAVGMCLFGFLSGLLLIGGPFAWPVGPVEVFMLAAIVVQITYFVMYGHCIDAYGFRLMTQTNTNEVIEFIRYYPLWASIMVALALAGIFAASVWVNLPAHRMHGTEEALGGGLAALLCLSFMAAPGRRSLLASSGFVSLCIAKAENTRRLRLYPSAGPERERGIKARLLGKKYEGPSTIVLVVGESANRDYMSAFVHGLDRDTTPWMNAMRLVDSRHWMMFPRAYSCGMHTFVSLEQGLTEKNQFNDADFVTASSIVDMAHAAGRRVHWYSNQGHLGASLSQVSVVAEQADEAMWTTQAPGLPPYDIDLLAFLDRVDSEKDNLVVLHLKGNHFSFNNRYPAEAETWTPEGPDDTRTTYMNSIHYVDDFLRRVWETGCERLNMKAMVYCSDHAIIPDRHRGPVFAGFGDVRIPLAVWTSDDFIAAHPERYRALQDNTRKYWTNDFLYDLMCGLMDVESPRFKPENSLAHSTYSHTRDTLTILDGTVSLADDDEVPDTMRGSL